jgi:putative nucleotidyltransferase with HDIG domain
VSQVVDNAQLIRLPTSQVCVGMYVNSFCGSWLQHDFFRTSFLIDSPKIVERLQASGLEAVMIDPSRGVAPVARSAAGAAPLAPEALAQAPAEPVAEVTPDAPKEAKPKPLAPLSQEMDKARDVTRMVRNTVESLFRDAQRGRNLDAQRIDTAVRSVHESLDRNPGALLSLVRIKRADEYTYMHSVAVSALMAQLAKTLGMDDAAQHQAATAGLLHDIGKVGVPNEILNKPGRLTEDEFTAVRNHPRNGYELLARGGEFDDVALDVCLHHHERIDGRGYPDRLKGDEITLFAKMGAICDIYDAISSNRPYKSAWTPFESLRQMASWGKGHLDHEIFRAFVQSIGVYPVGSIVKLKSNRLAIVTEQNINELRKPVLKAFYSTQLHERIEPRFIQLGKGHEEIVSVEDPEYWNLPPIDQLLT